MNLQLQGDELNLVKIKSVIAAFISKVPFKQNFGHGHLYQFPNLNRLRDNGEINDDDMVVYCNHLTMLHTNMCVRYADILSMTIPAWILDLFWSVGGADIFLQEELIELQAKEQLKPKLKDGYTQFWLQRQIGDLFPGLWKIVKKLLVPFPLSYLVEPRFNAVTDLLEKK
uniref:HAT C-terminal dimerisation domain-containing protein n=1 Tax=Trichuris muris TaxID=70415 RepID=A0A5S6Q1Z2_TRIMR